MCHYRLIMARTILPSLMLGIVSISTILSSCERDDVMIDIVKTQVTTPAYTDVEGFYLLNEGNMGGNKSTLDYFNAREGVYYKNIYAERNPNVVKELGDVGNDLLIYGSKLYAVINCSHKVEVMNVEDATRVTQIDIPNCRYAVGKDGYVYVSSYVGPVQVDPTAPKGAVFKVDTLSMEITGSVEVGYQPEEMTIIGNRLYVANSGGYRVPDYDNTISVIDLDNFTLSDVIMLDESANFHRLEHDRYGRLWLSSRGNYYGDFNSDLYVIDPVGKQVIKDMNIPVSDMWVDDGMLYVISAEWSYVTGKNTVSYAKIDMDDMEIVDRNIIKDGTDEKIKIPYGIAVDPVTKDIYVTDAKSYVVSGMLYCFDKDGICKWKQTAGQIPAHFAFKGNIAEE